MKVIIQNFKLLFQINFNLKKYPENYGKCSGFDQCIVMTSQELSQMVWGIKEKIRDDYDE